MKINQIPVIAAGGILLSVSWGCASQHDHLRLQDKVEMQQRMLERNEKFQQEMLEINTLQRKQISRLQDEMRAGFAATEKSLKQLTETSKEEPESDQDKLVDAALYLAKHAPNRYNAINTLGSIGGEKAEGALLDLLKTEQNYKSNIYQALMRMNSSKLRKLVLETMENPTPNDFNNLSQCFGNRGQNSLFTAKDLPLLLKYLNRMPARSYSRSGVIGSILAIDKGKGIELVCQEIMLNPNQNNIFHQLTSNKIAMNVNDWKKVINLLGPISSANVNTYQVICQAIRNSGDMRITDVVLPWAEFARKNSMFRNSYIDLLAHLKDPKVATVIVELQDSISNNYQRRRLEQCPGVVAKGGKLAVVDNAEMEKLMAQREKTISRLNEFDKKRAEMLKNTK